jgi:hypothetical protein
MHIDVLATDLGFTEGPVWLPEGRIALTSISHGCLYVVDPAGGPMERIDTGGGPNGLVLPRTAGFSAGAVRRRPGCRSSSMDMSNTSPPEWTHPTT